MKEKVKSTYRAMKKLGVLCLCCAVSLSSMQMALFAASVKKISAWEWANKDESLQFVSDNQRWEMVVSYDENTNIQKTLQTTLPSQMTATIVDQKDVETIDIEWDVESVTTKEKEVQLIASISELYTFTSNVTTPSITIIFNQKETKSVKSDTESSQDDIYANNVVKDAITPFGTVINVFDYWLDGKNEPDFSNFSSSKHEEAGINKEHSLKFSKGIGEKNKSMNAWTGDDSPFPNMVKNVLVDGYPWLISNKTGTSNPNLHGDESLQYVFDPSVEHEGKQSYTNATGLLQVDERGYYYYDSTKNYAYFNEDSNSFTLYNAPGIARELNGAVRGGQFFPFTPASQAFVGLNDDGSIQNGWTVDESGKATIQDGVADKITSDRDINHYFGLTMATRFIQQNGGKSYLDEAITYEFSGDDDVWVFIDDVLVADLGGIHDAASLSINFQSGKIEINGVEKTTLKQAFIDAGKENTTEWSGNTFLDDTTHTLRFYYLERGNYESNMSLKFNLVPIPENSVSKVDETGKGVEHASLVLYASDEQYTVDKNKQIFTGTTDANGDLLIVDEEGLPITFEMLSEKYNTNYFVLSETSSPEGYRGQADAHIRYEPDTERIYVEDAWETGNYGNNQITLIAPNDVTLQKVFQTGTATETIHPYELIDENDPSKPLGKFFAVVQKRKDMDKHYQDEDNWTPIYGSAQDGWHTTSNNNIQTILEAATANPVVLEVDASGALMGTVTNLPGELSQYYFALKETSTEEQINENLQYVGVLYYTTALIRNDDGTYNFDNVTADNTYRVSDDSLQAFDRKFSTRVSFSNVQNYFVVQKVDDEAKPIEGAKFNLYREDQTIVQNGQRVVNPNAQPIDTVTTKKVITKGGQEIQGAAIFPSSRMYDSASTTTLTQGRYYVVEDASNKEIQGVKYDVNPAVIPVVVDNHNVYVNAGSKDDGIYTNVSVASVLGSMVQFAVDDEVNTTLRDIKAQMLTTTSTNLNDATWSTWQQNADIAQSATDVGEIRLSYQGDDASGFYQEQTIGDITSSRLLQNDEGWSKLEIRQDMTGDTSLKTDLNDKDISNLFVPTIMLTVTNPRSKLGSLRIQKFVNDNVQGQQQDFTFTITLKDAQGNPIEGEFAYTKKAATNEEGVLKVQGGIAQVTLKHNEEITIHDLLDGTQYVVEEEENAYVSTSENAQGTITKFEESNVVFTNSKTTNITVHKVWDDGNNQDGKRPENIVVRLYANGKEVAFQELNEANQWTYTFEDLATYEGSTQLQYDVKEDAVADYEVSYEQSVDGFTITNTLQPETRDIYVTKNWRDNNNQLQKRPASITVELYADGDKIQDVALSTTNNYRHVFQDLPVYANGQKILYEVKEVAVDGYTSQIQGNMEESFVITNTLNELLKQGQGDLAIRKIVNGDATQQSQDFTFNITLVDEAGALVNAKYTYEKYALTEQAVIEQGELEFVNGVATVQLQHGQTVFIHDIEKGTQYNVEEEVSEGYISTVYQPNGTIVEEQVVYAQFINSAYRNITVRKQWDDGNNQDGKRPESIKITLYADGKYVQSQVLNEENQWTYTFEKLKTHRNDTNIVYSVEEEVSEGYEVEYLQDEQGFIIINHYQPEVRTITIEKQWDDQDDINKKRPTSIQVQLYANGVEKEMVVLDAKNDWKTSIDGLPVYEAGKEILYEVKELAVDGYTSKITGNMKEGFLIKNTYQKPQVTPDPDKEQEEQTPSQPQQPQEEQTPPQQQETKPDQEPQVNTQPESQPTVTPEPEKQQPQTEKQQEVSEDVEDETQQVSTVTTNDPTHKLIWGIVCGVSGIALFITSLRKKEH